MHLTVLDARTGTRVTLTVTPKPMSAQQARRQVLRKLDKLVVRSIQKIPGWPAHAIESG